MSHDNHTESNDHKEISSMGVDRLFKLVEKWKDPLPLPPLKPVSLGNKTIWVVRDDLVGFGTKARAAAAALSQPEYKATKVIVYVAPRVGWAPMSLAKVCAESGRRLILFAPACAEPSHHQLCAMEMGAEMRFTRIAAMPVLQRWASKFADDHGYTFFPLGLDVPAAVAGIASTAQRISDREGREPREVWTVISTGVLSRGLQLAWPGAKFKAVAVARNIKKGEKGKARIYSHPKAFLQNVNVENIPPFPTVLSYDAKAWEYIVNYSSNDAWFWNVAAEPPIKPTIRPGLISDVDWGDMSAFAYP